MTLHTRACCIYFAAVAMGLHGPASAGSGEWAASENPQDGVTKQGPMKPTSSYGMCSGPQNADAFAQSPVPVVEGKCDDSQTFSATSLGPSDGNGGCGGFTVAFGPIGNLRPYLDHVILRAEWGDAPLTAANCASAARNCILAGKSLPPFGTYTDAIVAAARSTVTMRFS